MLMRQRGRWVLLGSVALLACLASCAAEGEPSETDDTGPVTSSSTGGSGGSGGATTAAGGNTGPCGTDCTLINTPQCQVAQCNVQTGQCEVVNDEAGVACDDGLFCTISDSCSAGTCVGGPQNDCGMAPPQCTEVTCDETSQTCSSTPSMNGDACQDPNDLCLKGSTCSNGLCIGGTGDDCFFFPVPSDCHVATCNSTNGMCEAQVGNEGQNCNDPNDLCTVQKTCVAGVCQGGSAKDCSQLTVGCFDGVCDTMTGQCGQTPIMPGGMCQEATDQCNQGICDTMGMCNATPANEGNTCDDNDFCTSGETCTSGSCNGGAAVTQCSTGDGCCPNGCTVNNDLDCIVPVAQPAQHRGWWNVSGSHSSTNDNTLTGQSGTTSLYNAYFIFDLTGINGTTVISAELHLEVESYYGNDTSEDFSIWDVNTPWATLEASGNSVTIFNDLMQGTQYGSVTVLATEVTQIKVIPLNNSVLPDIQAALGGHFSVGVHLDSFGNGGLEAVRWSAGTEARTHELHFQVY